MGLFEKIKKINEKQKELQNKKMKMVAQLYHLEGISNLNEGEKVMLELNPTDNTIYIGKSIIGKNKNNATILNMDKFEYVESTTVSEIQEKNKSVIGRAVVGSLLGPIGAVVGGISGVGSKKKENNRNILIIGYSSNGQERQVSFIDGKGTMNYKILYNELKKYENKKEQKSGQTEL